MPIIIGRGPEDTGHQAEHDAVHGGFQRGLEREIEEASGAGEGEGGGAQGGEKRSGVSKKAVHHDREDRRVSNAAAGSGCPSRYRVERERRRGNRQLPLALQIQIARVVGEETGSSSQQPHSQVSDCPQGHCRLHPRNDERHDHGRLHDLGRSNQDREEERRDVSFVNAFSEIRVMNEEDFLKKLFFDVKYTEE